MDISMFAGPLATGVISAMITGVSVYVAVTNRLTKIETLIDMLRVSVDKHNHVVERMVVLETKIENFEKLAK